MLCTESEERLVRSQAGFSLMELMVAVAIVGIMTVIAVPSYNQYMVNSRRQEARLSLSALYAAESNYQSEFQSYTSCLTHAGYLPDSLARYYAIGFKLSDATATTCGGMTATTPNATSVVRGAVGCNVYQPGSAVRDPLPACSTHGITGTGAIPLTTAENQYDANQKSISSASFAQDSDFANSSPAMDTGIGLTGFTAAAIGVIGTSSSSAQDKWFLSHSPATPKTFSNPVSAH